VQQNAAHRVIADDWTWRFSRSSREGCLPMAASAEIGDKVVLRQFALHVFETLTPGRSVFIEMQAGVPPARVFAPWIVRGTSRKRSRRRKESS
jgi:hypothetical protein